MTPFIANSPARVKVQVNNSNRRRSVYPKVQNAKAKKWIMKNWDESGKELIYKRYSLLERSIMESELVWSKALVAEVNTTEDVVVSRDVGKLYENAMVLIARMEYTFTVECTMFMRRNAHEGFEVWKKRYGVLLDPHREWESLVERREALVRFLDYSHLFLRRLNIGVEKISNDPVLATRRRERLEMAIRKMRNVMTYGVYHQPFQHRLNRIEFKYMELMHLIENGKASARDANHGFKAYLDESDVLLAEIKAATLTHLSKSFGKLDLFGDVRSISEKRRS